MFFRVVHSKLLLAFVLNKIRFEKFRKVFHFFRVDVHQQGDLSHLCAAYIG
jgi:hypothetical protein